MNRYMRDFKESSPELVDEGPAEGLRVKFTAKVEFPSVSVGSLCGASLEFHKILGQEEHKFLMRSLDDKEMEVSVKPENGEGYTAEALGVCARAGMFNAIAQEFGIEKIEFIDDTAQFETSYGVEGLSNPYG